MYLNLWLSHQTKLSYDNTIVCMGVFPFFVEIRQYKELYDDIADKELLHLVHVLGLIYIFSILLLDSIQFELLSIAKRYFQKT